jgi:membrane-associated phospholipid phosphatase
MALNPVYADELGRLLHDGPGFLSPRDTKGLIDFPSYHVVLALLVMWYARGIRFLRLPALLLNSAVLFYRPVQGGHHMIDVIAAVPVAALAIFIAGIGQHAESPVKPSVVVNKGRKFTIGAAPEGIFRIMPEQSGDTVPTTIKSKLSGIS